MKKEKKNALLKGIGIILLIAVLLTWVTPSASFTEGVFSKGDYSRVGIFDISTYSIMGFSYFAAVFGYLFVLAGFSKFLNSLKAFKKLTAGIAKRVEKKPFIFVIVSMVIYAILASIIKETLVLFLFVPVTVAIMSELKQTKIATFTSSVGGILLGSFASTYNGTITAILKSAFTIKSFNSELIAIVALMVVGAALLGILTYFAGKNKDEETIENLLAEEVKKNDLKKVSTLPLIIVGVLLSVITILAFIDWSNSFGVSFFADLHTSINESTIGGVTVFQFLFGQSYVAFGEWTLYMLSGVLVITTFVLAIIYKVKANEGVESYIEGFKAYAKPILAVFLIYVILETGYFFPTLGIVYNWILDVFGDNAFTWTIISMIASVFNVSYEYVVNPLSGLFLYVGKDAQAVVALATQLGYGLVSFVAPSSMLLAFGLTTLDINYKKYLKFIWKFFATMTVISILVLIILSHIA